MKAGQPIRASLIYPVYSGETLVLPEHTILTGTVTELRSNHSQRVNARINGDFTPYYKPVVSFSQITLANGDSLAITTTPITDGSPILRLTAPPPRKGGFIRHQWDDGVDMVKEQIAVFTAPDKGDRLLQLFYHSLPYHPQRIEKGTAWTVETAEPISISPQPTPMPAGHPDPTISAGEVAEAESKPVILSEDSQSHREPESKDPESPSPTHAAKNLSARRTSPSATSATETIPATTGAEPQSTQIATEKNGRTTWIIQAYLRDQLTSATARQGQAVHAVVAEPIYNVDHTIAVPQGATLTGTVTRAKPARSFARAGVLRFDFKQIDIPGTQTQNVQASLTGADSASSGQLAMDSEGNVKPKPQDKIVVPLLLAFLATRPLDQDRDDTAGSMAGKNFVGSNGFGLAARIITAAGASPNVAAGIGAYGTAVSLYRRWIARGKDVTFVKDTRLVLQTTPRSSTILKPEPSGTTSPTAQSETPRT
jgi:hypothetical protein